MALNQHQESRKKKKESRKTSEKYEASNRIESLIGLVYWAP